MATDLLIKLLNTVIITLFPDTGLVVVRDIGLEHVFDYLQFVKNIKGQMVSAINGLISVL